MSYSIKLPLRTHLKHARIRTSPQGQIVPFVLIANTRQSGDSERREAFHQCIPAWQRLTAAARAQTDAASIYSVRITSVTEFAPMRMHPNSLTAASWSSGDTEAQQSAGTTTL